MMSGDSTQPAKFSDQYENGTGALAAYRIRCDWTRSTKQPYLPPTPLLPGIYRDVYQSSSGKVEVSKDDGTHVVSKKVASSGSTAGVLDPFAAPTTVTKGDNQSHDTKSDVGKDSSDDNDSGDIHKAYPELSLSHEPSMKMHITDENGREKKLEEYRSWQAEQEKRGSFTEIPGDGSSSRSASVKSKNTGDSSETGKSSVDKQNCLPYWTSSSLPSGIRKKFRSHKNYTLRREDIVDKDVYKGVQEAQELYYHPRTASSLVDKSDSDGGNPVYLSDLDDSDDGDYDDAWSEIDWKDIIMCLHTRRPFKKPTPLGAVVHLLNEIWEDEIGL